MSAISTSLASEQRTGRPEQLRGFSIFALVLVFIAVYFGSMFTPPLLDDADSPGTIFCAIGMGRDACSSSCPLI